MAKKTTIQHTVFGFNLMIEPINKINCNLEFVSIVILKEFAVVNTTL